MATIYNRLRDRGRKDANIYYFKREIGMERFLLARPAPPSLETEAIATFYKNFNSMTQYIAMERDAMISVYS